MTIGERVIDVIVGSALFRVEDVADSGGGHVIVWSANAADQIEEAVRRLPWEPTQRKDGSVAKFRSKPTVIEAVQFDGTNDPDGVLRRPEDNSPYVVTIHDQRCYLSPGDWIVPEPDGVHYYPIKPDVFAAKYEPIPEEG